jgi:hypothetical protein
VNERGRRLRGGIVAFVGWLLSPLSWWNDAFVNLPLAWLLASAVSLISHRLFLPAMVAGYWLTNIAGILMMARGTADAVSARSQNRKRQLALSLLAATGYTALMILLAWFGVLKPFHALLGRR